MAEKNSLWKNIRNKAKQNRKTGATPKKPTTEMLRQERKIKAKQYAVGGTIGQEGFDFIDGDGSTKPKKGLQTAQPKPPIYTRENYVKDIQANLDTYFKDGTFVTPYTPITKPDEKNCINGICYATRKLTNNAINIDYTSNPNFERDINKNNFYRTKLEDGFEIGDVLQYYTHKGSMLSGFPGKVTPVNSNDPWPQHAVWVVGKRTDEKGKNFLKIVNNRGTDLAKIEEISELDLMKRAQEGYTHYDGIAVNRYDPEKVQEFNRIKKENADIFSGKNSYAKEYDNTEYTGAFKPKDIYGKTLGEDASSIEFRKIINELYPTLGKSSNMPKEEFDFLMNYLYGIGHQESNWGYSGKKAIKDAVPESLYPTLRGWSDSDKDYWKQDYWDKNANNVKNKYKNIDEFKKSISNTNIDPEVNEYLRMHSPKSKGIFQQKELSERGRYFNYGFDDTKSQVASSAALLVDNYHKVKKKFPDKSEGELTQLAVLMHNSPSRALNPTYADYYPKRNDVDYFNKVKLKAAQPQAVRQTKPIVKSQTLSKLEKEKLIEFLNKSKSTGGNVYANGGPVNTLEGDLLSKVIMNRNRDKDFVQRAYAVGEYPESNMFVQPDANEFGQKNSHLMSWGEDENGQAYMYPKVMNPNNEDIKVPNQYADYISSIGYKKATGIPYATGGPMEYGNGGKVWKHIGAGAYSLGEGILDTVTMGATDQLTDKGFEGLTKLGNKNMDLSDPANAKFLRTQQQIKGYGNTTAAVATGIFTGNVQGAVTQGAKGLNTAFQATEGLSDDFKKWSNISNTAIGIGAGLAGGSLNTEGASASASEAAGKIGEIGGKISPYANQAVGMLGGNSQPMWQQAQAQQDLLNSPEYAAQQDFDNQQYVNQGLSFSHGGNIANNSLNLQSMKGRYNNYKNRYAKGGTFNQYGIDMIPDSAGLHHENAYGGVPIGPNALGEGGEIKMDTPDGGQYMVSDQVDGTESQKDFTFSKGGKYKELNRTLAEGMKQDLNRYSFGSLATNSNSKDSLRRPNDSYAQSTIDQIKQKWQQKTEFARQRSQQEQAIAQAQQQKQLIEEEYIAAYGGRINPKKYPGLNMPKKSKGGYVYNAMTQPMLAHGGPVVSNIQQPFNGPAAQNRGGMMMAQGGMMQQQGGQDQMMQLIQAYAEATGISPEEIIQQLQQMKPQDQQQAIQQMAQELQGGQQQPMQRQQMMPQQGMMARGGKMYATGGPGNTSSILSRIENRDTPQPIQPIQPIQSKPFYFSKDDTTPGLVGKVSNTPPYDTSGFIPTDVIANRFGSSAAPSTYGVGPINTSIPREVPIEESIKFTPSGASDMIEDLPGFTPSQTNLSNEEMGLTQPNLPKLSFTESDAKKYSLNPNDVNIIKDPKVKQPNQPNEGLTGLDYASMGMQALGPLSQLYYGLKGPDDVNYERMSIDKIDPYIAITLANEESRRAQDTAGYNLRQNAPTSGSYMANMRGLGLQAGKQRGAQTAATQYQADVANTQMQNQANAQNAQISMQEQIDRLQERDAARTNVTEGLSGMGASTANMIRDYKTNQVNQTIANNIGTSDWKYDPVNKTITFRNKDGKIFTVPEESVTQSGGYKNYSSDKPITSNFDKALNRGFRNRFSGLNSGE